MINVPYTSIQSKIKINGVLSDPLTLMRGVRQRFPLSMLLSIIAPDKLANFIDDNKKIKGIQIENYEIKIVNFSDNTTIFYGDIIQVDRIQVILKLYGVASSLMINFSKGKPNVLEHIKIILIYQDKWNGHNFPLQIFGS